MDSTAHFGFPSHSFPPSAHLLLSGFNLSGSHMGDSDRSTASGNYSTASSREEDNRASKLEFSEDEEALIARMYSLIGKRWALIAGRIPGRTAEEIEKYWTSRFSSSE